MFAKPSKPIPGALLAILSGLMLTVSFPPGRLSMVAWFALVPLLFSIQGSTSGQAFRLGLLTGLMHYLSLLYWILVVLGRYAHMSPIASTGPYLLLCFYLALFPACFAGLIPCFRESFFPSFHLGCLWIGMEYIRSKLMTGFPWCLLGYSQYTHQPLIQLSDLCGVYGVSFLIVLVNGAVHGLLFTPKVKGSRHALKWEVAVTVLLVTATILYGKYRLREIERTDTHFMPLKVSIVQGNIDQSVKWNPAHQAKTMGIYLALTRRASMDAPDLIVWPETAVPFFFQDDRKYLPLMCSMVKKMQTPLVFGSPAYKSTKGKINYFNRAYLLSPGTGKIQYYDKVHLVPFGEYVPLKRALFFLRRLVPSAGDFKSGEKIAPLHYLNLSMGILICFEAIFPELARAHARTGANLLVNLTNDAWFGMTGAPYQHLGMAVFRAVETRMPMIRAANTGFSALIGSTGKIVALGDLFTEQVLTATIKIQRSPPVTFYARFGDLFALVLLLLSAIRVVMCLLRKGSSRKFVS